MLAKMTDFANGLKGKAMTDYIKREDVVNLGVMMQTHLWTRDQTYNAIFCLPSADVAPVRHGRWDCDMGGVWCSVCGEYSEGEWNYCPNCGAKMDEETK